MTLPGTSFTTSEKIPREVFATGKSRIVGDLMDGDFAAAHDGTIAIGIRHVVCVPLLRRRRCGWAPGRERRTRSSASCIWTAASAARCCRRRRAARWRRLPRRPRWRSKAPGCTPSRPRRRASSATCGSPPRSSGRCCPSRTTKRRSCDLAAASVPCRTVGGDFYDYLERGRRRVRLRAGRRGRQGAAGGHPGRRGADAISPRRRQSAPIRRRRWRASTRRCCAARSRRASRRCSTAWWRPDGALHSCNAGQEPPLVMRRDGERWLETGGPVLGLLDGVELRVRDACSSSPATWWWCAATG